MRRALRTASTTLLVSALGSVAIASCAKSHVFERHNAADDEEASASSGSGEGGASASAGAGGAGGGAGGAGGGATGSGATGSGGAGGVPGPCTTNDDCLALGGDCSAGACVDGTCAKVPANEFGSCDDGLYCTENDICQNGLCVGGTPRLCSPPDSCHIGTCDEAAMTCSSAPGNDGAQCDDQDPCTASSSCSSGTCIPGAKTDCTFLDGTCTVGVCDAKKGCVSQSKNDGAPCDDGLFCTITDTCKGGLCGGAPNPCKPADADICMIGQCNEAAKQCIAVPGNDGKACNDANTCTSGETCSAGACNGGVPANEGIACDDADACTGGTTCANGACTNAKSQITQCVDGDGCCPQNCPTDTDCLYWASGVLENVDPAILTGWKQCYLDTYAVPLDAQVKDVLTNKCTKAKLLLACRMVGAPTWQLAAMAPREDVLFDCGPQVDCTHPANGVGWYYSPTWSWGFAKEGNPVSRNECDTNAGTQRLCWHTVNGAGGYRCGEDYPFDATWERAVFQAD